MRLHNDERKWGSWKLLLEESCVSSGVFLSAQGSGPSFLISLSGVRVTWTIKLWKYSAKHCESADTEAFIRAHKEQPHMPVGERES